MSDIAINIENVGKKYTISHQKNQGWYSTLQDSLANSILNARSILSRKKTLPSSTEEFWALRDVSVEIKRGDVVGIIGRNGAGKSTLLKIINRITEPTEGQICIDGKIASLLEVGTGFHPELTGRENVFLNGSILGMSRSEVRRKFDEIVAFAEVEKFLDTPVKRYSSGMYVRLAFAVAAHLDTEIIVIDEVLAVGDTAFQKKVLGKMGEVASGGRTVLFVSHNMSTLLGICKTGILLHSGRLIKHGDIRSVVKEYMVGDNSITGINRNAFHGPLKSVIFEGILLNGESIGNMISASPTDKLIFAVKGFAKCDVPDFRATFSLFSQGARLLTQHDTIEPVNLEAGPFQSTFTIPSYFLRPGEYSIAVGGRQVSHDIWTWGTDLSTLQISSEWSDEYDPDNLGLVNLRTVGRRERF